MICPTCERETAAVCEIGEMGRGKLRKRCAHPDCKAALPDERPARVAPTAPVDAALAEVPPVAGSHPATRSTPTNGAPPSFTQIVAQSEARLLQVRERIAELRALETEEKQLLLILIAAGKKFPPETLPS